MTYIKRLTELAGLKEYAPTVEFVTLDRAASDALTAAQDRNNTDSLEDTVGYYAKLRGVDYEELLATVNFYLKNPEKLMVGGMVSKMGEDLETNETITFSVNNEEGYNAIMDRYNDLISWDGEYMVASEIVFARIEDLFASMGIDGPIEVGSEDDYDGQPDEQQEWGDYMGGDDWDHGQYDETVDFGKRYEQYQEQLAFEDFEQAMQEAVTFAGGTPPEEREKAERGRLTQRFASGAADIAGQVTDQPTEPHAKTVIGDKEPWEYTTGDLGSSLGLKQKIDPENYVSVLSRDFSKWVKGSGLTPNKTRTVYDKMNNKQIKSTVWHPKGRHEDIIAFQILTGSSGNFAPGVYVRKDSASPEMIQRGRESGR